MEQLIQSREALGDSVYLNCADDRILGLDHCGCDLPRLRQLWRFQYGETEGIMVCFNHGTERCISAVKHDPKKNTWIPMPYSEYQVMVEEAAEDGEFGSI